MSAPPKDRAPLSVVIPTLNEAGRIGRAVADLAWADEIVVVDGGSADGTLREARAAGARVLECLGFTIGEQRNLGIAHARNEWVLALDADEHVPPELRDEIARVVHEDERARAAGEPARFDAFALQRREHFAGRELRHGSFRGTWHRRLFRRRYRFTAIRVHEGLEPVERVGRLRGALLHEGLQTMEQQLEKMIRYASWQADDMLARGRRAGALDLAFRPFWRVVREYVVDGAWRGGTLTFIQVVVASFSTFLKYAFMWTRTHAGVGARAVPQRAAHASTSEWVRDDGRRDGARRDDALSTTAGSGD